MTEFTIRIANRPGALAMLAEAMGDAGVNIEALAGFGIDGDGVVHLILDDEATGRAVLRRLDVHFSEREVLTTVLPHRPGAFGQMARKLAASGVNIDAVYLLRSSPAGLEFAVGVDDQGRLDLAG